MKGRARSWNRKMGKERKNSQQIYCSCRIGAPFEISGTGNMNHEITQMRFTTRGGEYFGPWDLKWGKLRADKYCTPISSFDFWSRGWLFHVQHWWTLLWQDLNPFCIEFSVDRSAHSKSMSLLSSLPSEAPGHPLPAQRREFRSDSRRCSYGHSS